MSDPVTYHWRYQGQTPDSDPTVDQSVIQSTPGDALNRPYTLLKGTSSGNVVGQLRADAQVINPALNGHSVVLPDKPTSLDGNTTYTITGSSVNPDPQMEDFLSWHSAHQLQLIKAIGKEVGSNKGLSFQFGISSVELEALVPTDSNKVIIIQQLTKNSIGNFSLAEQDAIAETESFQNVMAQVLGASPDDPDDVRDRWQGRIDDLIVEMSTGLNENDEKVFTDQLKIIRDRMDYQGIFVGASIQDKLDEIKARFDRAKHFDDTTTADEGDIDDEGVQASNSSDGLKTVKSGYDNFIAQEKRIADIARQRDQLARIGKLGDRAMDAPNIIFLFQLYYNLEAEAIVAAETEEIQQQNALLKDYAQMQQILNSVLGLYDVSKTDDKQRLLSDIDDDIKDLNDVFNEVDDDVAERLVRVLSMFDEQLSKKDDNTYHPIEAMNNIRRPVENLISSDGELLNAKKNVLDSFATRLSDAVTLINQNTQIKTNEINTLNSQKNRHFDLANNALRKLSDMVQTISRS